MRPWTSSLTCSSRTTVWSPAAATLPVYGARMSIEAQSPAAAATEASRLPAGAAIDADLPHWETIRVEAVREDVLDEDLAAPQLPDLVSGPEAAEMNGVTPQRVHALAIGKQFPVPAIDRPHLKLWFRAAIERFAEGWDRKPGRPRNVA